MSEQGLYYETRFAVVMYGGISLAIYINGVAQELYRMVRATARDGDEEGGEYLVKDASLDHSEKVYRDIGKTLGTKFVVDILSGTSAGGLNAIFLAKALANKQEFSALADVWKNVADVNTLIYDKESVKELPVRLEVPKLPPYLMNSQRMAYLLYQAFNDMKNDREVSRASDFVKELDLYVTATDLYGRNIILHTSDPASTPEEKRYRKMFHLRYSNRGDKPNDFTKEDSPFLAFISRCTSAIPPAFEPMTLNDMLTLPGVEVKEGKPKDWEKYFEETTNNQHLDRPYADGGYLDNKPFSYATEGLLNRTADHPVDRKLIYIDPAPQNLSLERTGGGKPNVFDNLVKAAVSLPMYEPIRDDLEAVHRRNRIIKRVRDSLHDVEKHLYDMQSNNIQTISNTVWPTLGLKECIEIMGPTFGTYITLRIHTMVDGIAMDTANSRNIDRQSAEFFELYNSVWAEFNKHYTSEPKSKDDKTWNKFLQDADIDWRIRRLNFAHRKIDELLVLASILQSRPSSLEYLGFARNKVFLENILFQSWDELKKQVSEAKDPAGVIRKSVQDYVSELLSQSIQKRIDDLSREIKENPSEDTTAYKAALFKWIQENFVLEVFEDGTFKLVKDKFNDRLNDLFNKDGFVSAFLQVLKQLKPRLNSIQNNLDDSRIEIRLQAKEIVQVDKYLDSFVDQSKVASGISSDETKMELGLPLSKKTLENLGSVEERFFQNIGDQLDESAREKLLANQIALLYLQAPYESYEYYDRMIYPLIVANDLGEADIVDIWRISPNDSRVFDSKDKKYVQKLGGQTLVSFGAFFKKEWRENDIMWGRLDGVEQIIRSLRLPDKVQEDYIQKAHAAILKNEVSQHNAKLEQILGQDLLYKSMPAEKSAIGAADDPTFDGVIMEAFKKEFSIDLSLEPRNALQLAARSTQVAGKMFEGLSVQYTAFAKWITRAGQFLFWTVEMATTESWLSMIARNIFFLLYFAGLVLVAVGSVFVKSKFPFLFWGWGIIGFTVFLQYARAILKNIMLEKSYFDLKMPQGDKLPKRLPFWRMLVPNPALVLLLVGLLLLLTAAYADVLMNFFISTKGLFLIIGAAVIVLGLLAAVLQLQFPWANKKKRKSKAN